jgi:hypothetical protein
MDLIPKSLLFYAAVSGIFSVIVVIFAALAMLARKRRRAARRQPDGPFGWAQSELEQFAADRQPEIPRDEVPFDETLMRADMVVEARRLISEALDQRRGRTQVDVEQALALGLGVTSSSGLRHRLATHLEQLQSGERCRKGSRIAQLRHLADAEETPAPPRPEPVRLAWRAGP